MKLPPLVTSGTHAIEEAPPGIRFDGRTRNLDVGDLPPGARFACRYVGRGEGVEVSMPMTIGATGEPAAPPKRRRAPAKK